MVTLAEVKDHCNIETGDWDALLEGLIAAAGDHLQSIGVNMDANPMPPAVQLAQKLLVAHFFENREATGEKVYSIELGVDRLIAPYREMDV